MRNVLRPEFGDVLLNSTGTGTIGRSVVFNSPGAFIVDGHVTVMRPRAELADSRWLNSVLRTQSLQRHLERFCFAGSTNQLELSRTPLRASRLPTPHIDDQRAMGLVIDTLDTAIHETEAIIAKLKAVKQGLLHDLLTRGIDANGELRPPQTEAPHLYKESPLGWIPKEWDGGTIGNYLDGEQGIKPGPFGSSIKKESYSESGFKVYGQEQVIGGDQEIGNYFVPLRKFQELQDFAVEVGDVLISLVGTIGKVLVLKKPLAPGLINPRLMRLRPDTRIAHPEFIGFLISSDSFVRQVIANAGGGTMPVINKGIIASIRAPVVPSEEQQEILKRRNAIEKRISWESAELEKFKAEKSGLMDDLLTGRVRITPLLAEAARQKGSA
jgi:type I restriction enzyme, S subunit